jgi:hypothetical protein
MRRIAAWRVHRFSLCLLLAALLALGSCTSSAAKGPSPDRSEANRPAASPTTAPGVSVARLAPTNKLRVTDLGQASAPGRFMKLASHIYSVTASGPQLHQPVRLRIALEQQLPPATPVLVATRETKAEAWTYLAGKLRPNGRYVTFAATHFGMFDALSIDVKGLIEAFKQDFLNGVDGGLTRTVNRPFCDQQAVARSDGFTISSSSGSTLYWCFGAGSAGRILKVTNRRRFPVELAHPNMALLGIELDAGAWASLSRIGSGSNTILAPGATATYNANLEPGDAEGISTEIDGPGQSLYALQVGVQTLVSILTRFNLGGGNYADAADTLLTIHSCSTSVAEGSGDILAGCFSPADLVRAFGTKGLLLAHLMTARPLVAFFHAEVDALVSQFNDNDRYQIFIKRAAPTFDAFAGQWYGHTRSLVVSESGAARESIGDGCCNPIIDLTYQLSNPVQQGDRWTATATVTSVVVHDNLALATAPSVGAIGQFELHSGVINVSLSRTNYCDESAGQTGICGA